MKKKKIIFIIIGILLALFIVLVTYFVIRDFKEEKKLREDIIEINDMINSEKKDFKVIKKRLKTYVTTGDNLKLEKSVKEYYIDSVNLIEEFDKIYDEEKLSSILTISNFVMDGKDFVISKNYLSNVNDNLDNYSKRVNKQLSNKKIMSYYNKYKLDSYYEELFNDLINNFSYFGTESSFDKEIDYIKNFVKNIDNVITFLIDNKDYWNIVNYNIEFNNIININNLDNFDIIGIIPDNIVDIVLEKNKSYDENKNKTNDINLPKKQRARIHDFIVYKNNFYVVEDKYENILICRCQNSKNKKHINYYADYKIVGADLTRKRS